MSGWVAVDLDATLAEYHGWPADGSIGAPIPAMVERVKGWIEEGKDVRIFTARVWPVGVSIPRDFPQERYDQATEQYARITSWCKEHLGRALPVTCVKDYGMVTLYDDRAVQVEANTGRLIGQVEKPLKQHPTVGRIVIYNRQEEGCLVACPAIVQAVYHDSLTLWVFGPDHIFDAHGVHEGDGPGEWRWPVRG